MAITETPGKTHPFDSMSDNRILTLVSQLGEALLNRAALERKASDQASAIEAEYAATRATLAKPSREASRLREEMARLEKSTAAHKTAQSLLSKRKETHDREYLEQALAHKIAAIRIADEQIALGQVEINGQKFSARELLADMETRERELYAEINRRNPWLAFLIELFGDTVAKDRQELAKRINGIRKEYDRQTTALKDFRKRLEAERDEVALRLSLLTENATLSERQQQISTKVLEARRKALAEVQANDASAARRELAAAENQRLLRLQALDTQCTDARTVSNRLVAQAVEALNIEVHRLHGEQTAPAASESAATLLPADFPSEVVLDWISVELQTGDRITIPQTIPFPLPDALRC